MAYFQGIEARLEKPCRDAIEGMGQELLVYVLEELILDDSLKDFASTKSNADLKKLFKPNEIKDVKDGITQFKHLDITNIYKFIEHHCNFDRADFKIPDTLAFYLWKIKDERNEFCHGDLKQTLATRDAVVAKIEDLKVLYKNVIMKLGEKQCAVHGRKMNTYTHYAEVIVKRLDDLRPEMTMADLAKQMEMLSSEIKMIHVPNQQNVHGATSPLNVPNQQNVHGATSPLNVVQLKKKVFILNIIEYTNELVDRKGSENDSSNLRSAFVSLGYDDSDVHIHENLIAADTDDVLAQIQRDTSLDYLFLMVLSHGMNTDTFYTSDGQEYSLRSIQARFTDDACPHLKDKAKVIICDYDRGNYKYTDTDVYSEDTVHNNRKVPITRHMITIHSSREGCCTIRNTEKGSYFVRTFCEVLKGNPDISLIDAYNLIEEKMRGITYRLKLVDGLKVIQGAQLPEMKITSPVPQFNF